MASYTIDINARLVGYQKELEKMQRDAQRLDVGSGIRKQIEAAIQAGDKQLQKMLQQPQIRVSNDNQIEATAKRVNDLGMQVMHVGELFKQVTAQDLDMSKFDAGTQSLQQKISVLTNTIQTELSNAMQNFISSTPELTAFFNSLGDKFDVKNASIPEFLGVLQKRAVDAQSALSQLQVENDKLYEQYMAIINSQNELTQSMFSQNNFQSTLDNFNGIKQALEPFLNLRKFLNETVAKDTGLDSTSFLNTFFQGLTPENLTSHLQSLRTRMQNELARLGKTSTAGTMSNNQLISALLGVDIKTVESMTKDQLTKMVQNITNIPQLTNSGGINPIAQLQDLIQGFASSGDAGLKGTNFGNIFRNLANSQIAPALNDVEKIIYNAYARILKMISDKQQELNNVNQQGINNAAEIRSAQNNLNTANADLLQAQNSMNAVSTQQKGNTDQLNQAITQLNGAMQTLVNSMHNTGKAAQNNAQQFIISAQQAQQYSMELENIKNREQLVGRIQGLIQRWFSIYSVVRMVSNAVKEVINTVKELDKTITDIAIVTNLSHSDLWGQMENYSNLAKQYGTSISGAYKVSQLYYQQGLQTNDVLGLTAETLKMARIAGMEYEDATNLMTNALRSFKMEMSEANRVTDVYAALAASSASSVEELAEAMSKTASSAQAVGSSFENTSAMMAVMIEATR